MKRRKQQSSKACRANKKANKVKKEQQAKYRKEKKKKMPSQYRDTKYIKLAMPCRFLVEDKYSSYMDKIKEWYDKGILTEITFFAFGKWNSKTKKRLLGIIKKFNNEWAQNHLVFRMPNESNKTYMLRVLRSFDITHYAGLDEEYMKVLVMSNLYSSIRSFFWRPEAEEGWNEFREWFKRYNYSYYRLLDKGDSADKIIQTGINASVDHSEPELVAQNTADSYDAYDTEWFGV